MSLLKLVKTAFFQSVEHLGLASRLLNSSWRQQRLLILAYHGVAMEDEYLWRPGLYMQASLIRRRFEYLQRVDCSVLPLDDAISRLYEGTLPERSVVLTFDDGTHDFYRLAVPILRDYGFPATVYFSTYYSGYNRPVFDIMCPYLLWKGVGRALRLPAILTEPVTLAGDGSATALQRILKYTRQEGLSAAEKDALLCDLAAALDIDYEALCRKRILCLMTPTEAREAAEAGIDVQLHTHRHRAPEDRDLFRKEIADNRQFLAAITSSPRRHFCYPSGVFSPSMVEWLAAAGISSAVTCEPGLATRYSPSLLLPRILDSQSMSMAEFAAWISGAAGFLPRRDLLTHR